MCAASRGDAAVRPLPRWRSVVAGGREHIGEGRTQQVGRRWLVQDVFDAERVQFGVRVASVGKYYRWDKETVGAHSAEQLNAARTRKEQLQHDDVNLMSRQLVQRLVSVRYLTQLCVPAERNAQRRYGRRIVIDDEYFDGRCYWGS
jgi:hypothetical protein